MEAYFPYKSTGVLRFDPQKGTKHFEPWWGLLACCKGIPLYYSWFLKKNKGIDIMFNALWGSHVSVIKGEKVRDRRLWAKDEGRRVEFWYSNVVRMDNREHAWLDVFSPDMSDIRVALGLRPKSFYHLTVGRLM
jgi:hypothetical protein